LNGFSEETENPENQKFAIYELSIPLNGFHFIDELDRELTRDVFQFH